jgi:pilus assembly protein Flp/PilA
MVHRSHARGPVPDLVGRLSSSAAGQGLAEYGLILALVAILCIAALTALQGGISNTLNSVANAL